MMTAPGPRNISSIVSWTYAALAHATITISNSTSDLTYLCKNFDNLSSRYYTAFASSDGDVAKLAKEAICDASKSSNPSPLPVPQNMLWYMKMYTGGVFNLQAYSAKTPSTKWYFDMCYYIEASLLKGLWAPCRDATDEGGVDVEGGFCVAAGYFGKGPFSKYTNATQSADVARQADVLMSKVMASVFKVVAGEKKQIEYVCNNWKRFESGFSKTSLVASTVKEMVCGSIKVVDVKQAKLDLQNQMTDLFVFQILRAGNYEGYSAYLCSTLGAESLSKYGINGVKAIEAVCKVTN
jgi:hypothetical protein